jgi:hypothetical protein
MTSDAISQPVPCGNSVRTPAMPGISYRCQPPNYRRSLHYGVWRSENPLSLREMGSSLTAMLDGNWPVARVAKRFLALNTT